MNQFLASRYTEVVSRLALGIELVDVLSGAPTADFVRIDVEAPGLPGETLPPTAALRGHGRGRWSARYRGTATPTEMQVRITDDRRRHVPRRFKLTIPSETQVIADAALDPMVITPGRRWQITLHPGADYPLPTGATAIRGRVLRGGQPVRWARVEARTMVGAFAGRAHGDDRGEFLLVVDQEVGDTAELRADIQLEVRARGPEPAPVAASTEAAKADPLWDLAVEVPTSTGPTDAVTRGTALPTAAPTDFDPGRLSPWTTVTCPFGSTTSCPTPFVLA